MVETNYKNINFKNKYLKYKLKYQKLQQKNQKGGMDGNATDTIMSRQPNQFEGAFMPVFFAHIVEQIKDQLYYQLFNVSKDISLDEIIDNLKEILKIINIPEFVNMCKSDQSVNNYSNQNMDFIRFGDDDSILYHLEELQTKNQSEKDSYINDLKSRIFRPYIKLLEKYKNTPYNGMTLMDVIQLVNDYINLQNYIGHTPLQRTVARNNTEMAKLLIENGAHLNIQDQEERDTLLSTTIRNDNTEMAKIFIEAGADLNIPNRDGETPLFHALFYNNTEIVTLLIENGAYVNIQNNYGDTPILLTIGAGNTEIAKLLIKNFIAQNTDLNKGVKLLLNLAMYKDYNEMTKILIENLVAQNADLNIQDYHGYTPLHHAIINGNDEIAILLIEIGAVKKNEYAYKALEYAIERGNTEIATLLTERVLNY